MYGTALAMFVLNKNLFIVVFIINDERALFDAISFKLLTI